MVVSDADEMQPQKLAWSRAAKRLAVGKRPVESGLNQAPQTGFVNQKPRRKSADPSDLAPIVSWALRDLPDLIQRSVPKANGSRVEFRHNGCRRDLVFASARFSTFVANAN